MVSALIDGPVAVFDKGKELVEMLGKVWVFEHPGKGLAHAPFAGVIRFDHGAFGILVGLAFRAPEATCQYQFT